MALTAAVHRKVGETFYLQGFVLAGADGVPANFATVTSVLMSLRPRGGGTPVYDHVVCTFAADATGKLNYYSPAVITASADYYEMDFEVRYVGGLVQKFPEGGATSGDAFVLVKISESAA